MLVIGPARCGIQASCCFAFAFGCGGLLFRCFAFSKDQATGHPDLVAGPDREDRDARCARRHEVSAEQVERSVDVRAHLRVIVVVLGIKLAYAEGVEGGSGSTHRRVSWWTIHPGAARAGREARGKISRTG